MSGVVDLLIAERVRQVTEEGYSPGHDREHSNGELALAAACYAIPVPERLAITGGILKPVPELWPWMSGWWKPTPEDRVRELVKAGALIMAEIERLSDE